MADSIRAQITANIVSALQGITTANGYNTDVSEVDELRIIPRLKPHMMIVQALPLDVQEDYQHSGHVFYRYNVCYFPFVNDDYDEDGTVEAFQHQCRNVDADVTKAIMQDRTRGGLALNTGVDDAGPEIFGDVSGNVTPCFMVQISVECMINADNPYELA